MKGERVKLRYTIVHGRGKKAIKIPAGSVGVIVEDFLPGANRIQRVLLDSGETIEVSFLWLEPETELSRRKFNRRLEISRRNAENYERARLMILNIFGSPL